MAKTIEKIGICKFCQQSKYIRVAEDMPDEEINDQVSYECSCEAGKIWRAGIDEKKRIEAMILEAKGISFALLDKDKPAIENLVNDLVPVMVKNEIKKISICHEKTKVTIRSTSQGVTITRNDTYSEEGRANK